MKDDTNNEAPDGGLLIRDLFGFLWDLRPRQVNHRSFWYGYLMAGVVYKIVDAAFEMKVPDAAQIMLLLFFAGIAKWLQATHPLK